MSRTFELYTNIVILTCLLSRSLLAHWLYSLHTFSGCSSDHKHIIRCSKNACVKLESRNGNWNRNQTKMGGQRAVLVYRARIAPMPCFLFPRTCRQSAATTRILSSSTNKHSLTILPSTVLLHLKSMLTFR